MYITETTWNQNQSAQLSLYRTACFCEPWSWPTTQSCWATQQGSAEVTYERCKHRTESYQALTQKWGQILQIYQGPPPHEKGQPTSRHLKDRLIVPTHGNKPCLPLPLELSETHFRFKEMLPFTCNNPPLLLQQWVVGFDHRGLSKRQQWVTSPQLLTIQNL